MRSAALLAAAVLALVLAAPARAGWQPLGGSVRDLPMGAGLYTSGPALADVGGVPWITWTETVGNNVENIRAARWDGTAWQEVGGSINPATGRGMHPAITSVLGVPYVAWAEYGGLPAVRVSRWTGTSWVPVGDPIPVEYSDRVWLGIANVGGTPWLTTTVRAPSGTDQKIAAFRLQSGAWARAGGLLDGTLSGEGERPAIAAVRGAPHVVFEERLAGGGSDVRVARFDGADWSLLGGPLEQDPPSSPATIANTGGAATVAFTEEVGGDHVLRVRRFGGTAWTVLGGAVATGVNSANRPVLARADGRAHVGWIQDTDFHVARLRHGSWTSIGLTRPKGDENEVSPALANVAGTLHAAWHETAFDPLRESVRAARHEPDVEFERAWGEDVVQGAPVGVEICIVASSCKQGTLDSPGGGAVEPQDVAVGPDGRVYVADAGHGTSRVQVFTPDGEFVRAFGHNVDPTDTRTPHVCTDADACGYGQSGDRGGALNMPQGIAVSPEGRVLVAEAGGQRVSEFESDGTFVRLWGRRVNAAVPGEGFEICTAAQAADCTLGLVSGPDADAGGGLLTPWDVAADAAGNVYVSDWGNHRVQKFDADRGFVHAVGAGVNENPSAPSASFCAVAADCRAGVASGAAGGLSRPTGIAFADGGFYVAEGAGNRISRFTAGGAFERAWGRGVAGGAGAEVCTATCAAGSAGELGGEFGRLAGVAAGGGRVYAVDGNRVQRFDASGAFQRAWGRGVDVTAPAAFGVCRSPGGCRAGASGTLGGELQEPGGLDVGSEGAVFVADTVNRRIVRYTGEERSPSGETSRVSVDSQEAGGNSYSEHPSVSGDGRYVAFESAAANLVPGDTNGVVDVFVRDRVNGTTERVSVDASGGQVSGASGRPAISADGRYVAFESGDPDLVGGDTNGVFDIFVFDRQTKAVQRVNLSSGGGQALQRGSRLPAISADGRFVSFSSGAENLVADDSNEFTDVFVRDRVAGTTQRVSVGPAGAQGDDSTGLRSSISNDGRHVAFPSLATNLVEGDTNSAQDLFVRDRQAGVTERVSVATGGGQADGEALFFALSPDGRFVAFDTYATNLVRGDTNGQSDVFVRDRREDVTQRVSVTATGAQAARMSYAPAISEGGRRIAFVSLDPNLVPDDVEDEQLDVFVADRRTGAVRKVSVTNDETDPDPDGPSVEAAIAGDGAVVAFASFATNLTPGDDNQALDVFAHVLRSPPPPVPPPAAPTVTGVSPASGANDNNPRITGTAAAGTTVRLYGNAQCSGTPLATGTAAAFASPGLTITVADNSTTTVFATASDAGGTSPCSSTSVTYVENSAQTIIKWGTTTASLPETIGTIGLVVERTGDTSKTTTVAWETVDGTAVNPADYAYGSGTVTFAPGETQQRVEITIVDDNVAEPDESLTVRLAQPSGDAALQPPSAHDVTIVDDDRIETTIVSGPEGPTDDATPTFGFTADPAAGATFECAVDGGAFAECPSTHTLAALPDGAHTLQVRAVRPNGSRDLTPATREFLVDTVRPVVSALVLGDSRGGGRYAGNVQVTGIASDPVPGSGVKELRCQLDPPQVPETASDLRGSCPINTALPGEHTAYLAAIDHAGWAGIPEKVTFTIMPEPETTILDGPGEPLWTTAAQFAFTSSMPGSTYRCRVDEGPWAPCANPHLTATVNPGEYVFEVAAISPDGVADPTPARRAFTINAPRTLGGQCIVYVPRDVGFFFNGAEGCESYTRSASDTCKAPSKCRKLPSNCPRGAVCTLEASTQWFDADPVEWWHASSKVELNAVGGYSYGYARTDCDAGWNADRCFATARSIALGAPSDVTLSCRAFDSGDQHNPPRGWPTYGADSIRRIECATSFTIAPAGPLLTVPGPGGVQVAVPGAGILTVTPPPRVRRATIAARRPLFTARPVSVAEAGPATVKLRLSKPARRKLRRKRKLPLSLAVSYTPAGGGDPLRATQKVTLRRAPKPLRVCQKVKGKRRCKTF